MRSQPVNPVPPSSPNFGPCLYLGPSGQRCSLPARQDGFCARHSPEASAEGWVPLAQRAGAILLLVALLWPLLVDLLREILGRFR